MGDRTSIQFKNSDEISPVLYEHYGGTKLLDEVDEFLADLKEKFPHDDRCDDPITRREPSAVLVMFITKYVNHSKTTAGGFRLVDSNRFYSNNDNGHWIIDLETMTRTERVK